MRSLEFDIAAFEDLAWWIEKDRAKALRIVTLIKEIKRDPFKGIGKPEPLKHEFTGLVASNDREHRIVYQVTTEKIRILACRYHY